MHANTLERENEPMTTTAEITVLQVRCCGCGSLRTPGGWVSCNDSMERMVDGVSHSLCPACYQEAIADMERELASGDLRLGV